MTNHYINLVSWEYFAHSSEGQLHCDSRLMALLSAALGVKIVVTSGPGTLYKKNPEERVLILGEKSIRVNAFNYSLPFWKSQEEVKITGDLIDAIDGYNIIYIGISSPKQDRLAHLLNKLNSDKHYFCFGAALYSNNLVEYLEKYGLMFLGFLISKPIRTTKKFYISLWNIFRIIFFKDVRTKFLQVMVKINETKFSRL
ncbi:MAG: hypothetical protein ACPGAO_08880 [Flavobacteriaceae bacterium]